LSATGVGKTAIIKRLPRNAICPSRPTEDGRPDEIDGSDHFSEPTTVSIIRSKNKQFVQIAVEPTGDFLWNSGSVTARKSAAVYAVVVDVIPIFSKPRF